MEKTKAGRSVFIFLIENNYAQRDNNKESEMDIKDTFKAVGKRAGGIYKRDSQPTNPPTILVRPEREAQKPRSAQA